MKENGDICLKEIEYIYPELLNREFTFTKCRYQFMAVCFFCNILFVYLFIVEGGGWNLKDFLNLAVFELIFFVIPLIVLFTYRIKVTNYGIESKALFWRDKKVTWSDFDSIALEMGILKIKKEDRIVQSMFLPSSFQNFITEKINLNTGFAIFEAEEETVKLDGSEYLLIKYCDSKELVISGFNKKDELEGQVIIPINNNGDEDGICVYGKSENIDIRDQYIDFLRDAQLPRLVNLNGKDKFQRKIDFLKKL